MLHEISRILIELIGYKFLYTIFAASGRVNYVF